jgi:hypothetical protein
MLEYQRGNYLHQNACSALLPPIEFRNLLDFTKKGIMGFFCHNWQQEFELHPYQETS